jgi:hypothetical protein
MKEGSMPGDSGERVEATAPVTETGASGYPTKRGSRPRRLLVRALTVVVALVVAWLLLAYLLLPALWRHYEHHPALENAPKTTRTAQGIPGDALNVGLIGTEQELVRGYPVIFSCNFGYLNGGCFEGLGFNLLSI